MRRDLRFGPFRAHYCRYKGGHVIFSAHVLDRLLVADVHLREADFWLFRKNGQLWFQRVAV